MGDINFKPDSERFFVVINNKTHWGAPSVLCAKALEEWEQKNEKKNSKKK